MESHLCQFQPSVPDQRPFEVVIAVCNVSHQRQICYLSVSHEKGHPPVDPVVGCRAPILNDSNSEQVIGVLDQPRCPLPRPHCVLHISLLC